MRNPNCLFCHVSMEKVFIPMKSAQGKFKMEWFEGNPLQSFWKGIKPSGKKQYFVAAYHCPKCQKIDLYSEKEVEEF